ncbi:hypothetical protein [Corynebacterium sp.]|uniref:hypothetical protein n=1 Tax=Corynebacterium sp. TaxID=1720 RepID=UPI00257BCFC6|nr:hypothetical protein [Corynebacterium sp.]
MATTTSQAETTADVLVIGFGKAGKTIAMNRAEHGDALFWWSSPRRCTAERASILRVFRPRPCWWIPSAA